MERGVKRHGLGSPVPSCTMLVRTGKRPFVPAHRKAVATATSNDKIASSAQGVSNFEMAGHCAKDDGARRRGPPR